VVRFEATIRADGKVDSLRLVSGPPLLVQAALEAAEKWVWQPTLIDGAAVAVTTVIDVPFILPAR
jgi:protein TonB